MNIFRANPGLTVALIVTLALALLAGGYLALLQAQGAPEPVVQSAPPQDDVTILEGTYVCLPPNDGSKPKECTPGIKVENGDQYALDLGPIIEAGGNPKLTNNEKIVAGGTVVPIEEISSDQWQKYSIKGIMRVEEVARE